MIVLSLILLNPPYSNANSNSLFRTLKSDNHIILLRHSLAPGIGDPDNVKLSDCRTQRNLSRQGIEQAKNIRVLLKKNGIKKVNIYSSEWCRCKETAKELGLGSYKTLSLLNSFFPSTKLAFSKPSILKIG